MTELCIHFANLFYLASFLGRDMLWLRALTCVGLVFGIIFFTCQPMPLYGPTFWHVLFLVINAVQIYRLVKERRRLKLNEEQEFVSEAAFRNLSREQLLDLLTQVVCEPPDKPRKIREMCRRRLTEEEAILRDIAFSRLSKKELLNLLTRRLWKSVRWMNPNKWNGPRWRRGPASAEAGPADEGRERSKG